MFYNLFFLCLQYELKAWLLSLSFYFHINKINTRKKNDIAAIQRQYKHAKYLTQLTDAHREKDEYSNML